MTSHILPVYNRTKIKISHGKGAYLYGIDGRKYLDFISGIATNCLGHCPDVLVEALHTQAQTLWHVSNLFEIPGMDALANLLTSKSFADTLFFCNSGTEAIECCIKMVRKYHNSKGHTNKYRIITFDGAFHGRTLAALWAGKRDALMQEGFGPPVEGFDNVPFGNIEAVANAITPETAAILIEPIQGDGGVRPAPKGFLSALRQLCDERGLLLCFDEIQCGMGRSGTLFAYEQHHVTPDIMTLAKGIGGGFPLGACLATTNAASGMTLGTHGSTYGGNPLAMAVGNHVFEIVSQPSFLANVTNLGNQLKQGLERLTTTYPHCIAEVRGTGLMLGIKCVPPHRQFMEALIEQGLLLAPAGENVLRILSPLNIESSHVSEALEILERTCRTFRHG